MSALANQDDGSAGLCATVFIARRATVSQRNLRNFVMTRKTVMSDMGRAESVVCPRAAGSRQIKSRKEALREGFLQRC